MEDSKMRAFGITLSALGHMFKGEWNTAKTLLDQVMKEIDEMNNVPHPCFGSYKEVICESFPCPFKVKCKEQ